MQKLWWLWQPKVTWCLCEKAHCFIVSRCLPDSPKPDSPKPDLPKLGFRVRVRVSVSENRVSANRVSANRDWTCLTLECSGRYQDTAWPWWRPLDSVLIYSNLSKSEATHLIFTTPWDQELLLDTQSSPIYKVHHNIKLRSFVSHMYVGAVLTDALCGDNLRDHIFLSPYRTIKHNSVRNSQWSWPMVLSNPDLTGMEHWNNEAITNHSHQVHKEHFVC